MEQSQELIIVENTLPLADSREIAKQLGVDHRSFFKLITEYQKEIEEDFGQVRFQIALGYRQQGGGNPAKYALLTENQAYILMMYTQNTEQARACKRLLVKAFDEAKQRIAEHTITPADRIAQIDAQIQHICELVRCEGLDEHDRAVASIALFRLVHTTSQLKQLTRKIETKDMLGTQNIEQIRRYLEQIQRHVKQIEHRINLEDATHDVLLDLFAEQRMLQKALIGSTAFKQLAQEKQTSEENR